MATKLQDEPFWYGYNITRCYAGWRVEFQDAQHAFWYVREHLARTDKEGVRVVMDDGRVVKCLTYRPLITFPQQGSFCIAGEDEAARDLMKMYSNRFQLRTGGNTKCGREYAIRNITTVVEIKARFSFVSSAWLVSPLCKRVLAYFRPATARYSRCSELKNTRLNTGRRRSHFIIVSRMP